MSTLSPFARETFGKPKGRLDVFSDVFGNDHDVVATTDAHSHVTGPRNYVPIRNPLEAAYFVELLVELNLVRRAEVAAALTRAQSEGRCAHPDILADDAALTQTTHCIVANQAPRIGTETNGRDFLVGLTPDGDEVYGVPPETLSYVRDLLTHVFRVPTNVYFGRREQFRSARIAHSVRTQPDLLEPLYQCDSLQQLRDGLRDRSIRSPIPAQRHPHEFAFTDEFGNLRARVADLARTREVLDSIPNGDGIAAVRVLTEGRERVYRILLRQPNGRPITCLREIPPGELGCYVNVNDEDRGARAPGYVEFVRKWEDGDSFDESRLFPASELLGRPNPGTPFSFERL